MNVYGRKDQPTRIALRVKVPLLDDASPRTWVQVAVEGTWEGHPAGSFTFTREVFGRILENFSSQTNPIPMTYEHPDRIGDGQPVPAAGWIRDLKVRGDELWAFVEFTPKAATMVREGEYRFCSVVVDFASTDRRTAEDVGPELFEVGLTNVPFLDGMEPIRLSRAAARSRRSLGKGKQMNDKELIAAALRALGDDATLQQVVSWVEAKKTLDGVESGESADAPAEPAEATAAADDTSDETVAAADTVDADAVPPAPVDLQEGEAEAAAAMSAIQVVADAAGLDASAVIAAMQERPEAFAAAAGAAPPDGTEADAVMGAELSRAQLRDLRTLAATRATELTEMRAELSAERERGLDRDIERAVERGHILDTEAKTLRKFARTSASQVRERLAEAEGEPAVSDGTATDGSAVVRAGPNAGGANLDAIEADDPRVQRYYKALAHIKDKDERMRLAKEKAATFEARRDAKAERTRRRSAPREAAEKLN